MVSKYDLVEGILVLIAGIIIYEFSPAGAMYAKVVPGNPATIAAHGTTHYVGGAIAVIFGIVGLALYKKVNTLTLGVSVLSIILGVIFAAFVPGGPLFPVMQPHGLAMEATGGITALVGIIGIAGAFVVTKSITAAKQTGVATVEQKNVAA